MVHVKPAQTVYFPQNNNISLFLQIFERFFPSLRNVTIDPVQCTYLLHFENGTMWNYSFISVNVLNLSYFAA